MVNQIFLLFLAKNCVVKRIYSFWRDCKNRERVGDFPADL